MVAEKMQDLAVIRCLTQYEMGSTILYLKLAFYGGDYFFRGVYNSSLNCGGLTMAKWHKTQKWISENCRMTARSCIFSAAITQQLSEILRYKKMNDTLMYIPNAD